jgi:hypothetical protein
MKSVTLDQMSLLEPDRAWVTGGDESVVLMYEPRIVRDTLVGYIGRHKEKVPGVSVKQVRVQTAAPSRTALLAVGIAAGLTGFLVVVAGTSQGQEPRSMAGPVGDCVQDPDQYLCTGIPDP